MKLEEMRKLVKQYDDGMITLGEAESYGFFKNTKQITDFIKKHGDWMSFGSCCCSADAHKLEDNFEGNISITPHCIKITPKKKKKLKEPTPENIHELITWRDRMALDWSGEDLVFHILNCLCETDGHTDQIIPENLKESLIQFRSAKEKTKYDWIKQSLKEIGSY